MGSGSFNRITNTDASSPERGVPQSLQGDKWLVCGSIGMVAWERLLHQIFITCKDYFNLVLLVRVLFKTKKNVVCMNNIRYNVNLHVPGAPLNTYLGGIKT